MTAREKEMVMGLVKAELGRWYPGKLRREEFTEVNRKVCRWMYGVVGEERGEGGGREERWRGKIRGRVEEEVGRLGK